MHFTWKVEWRAIGVVQDILIAAKSLCDFHMPNDGLTLVFVSDNNSLGHVLNLVTESFYFLVQVADGLR